MDSLWTVLSEANCGEAVNASKFRQECKTVAIDLSIWICEAMASPSLTKLHVNPSLNLVYRRIVKLIKMGITPIAVLEGNLLATLVSSEISHYKKRRTCSRFHKACQDCELLLSLLGVAVLKANGEGEALCALLNKKGLVDGIITNDGDVFLYGGIQVYTHFSISNLEKGQVIRYKGHDLRALCVHDTSASAEEDETDTDNHDNIHDDPYEPLTFHPSTFLAQQDTDAEKISLSQDDLIAFALLTGSDIFGGGLPFVGYKKAIRFIQGTKKRDSSDPSTSKDSAESSLKLLKSWMFGDREILRVEGDGIEPDKSSSTRLKYCSVCLHVGDSRSHRRQGCKECGSKVNCIQAALDERFRQSLKQKVMLASDRFLSLDELIAHYKTADDNNCNIGAILDSQLQLQPTSNAIMKNCNLIVSGHSLESSREFLWLSLSKLFARLKIRLFPSKTATTEDDEFTITLSLTRIIKRIKYENQDCYKVLWTHNNLPKSRANSSLVVTIEWQSLVENQYPTLVQEYYAEQRRAEQRQAKMQRHILFFGRATSQPVGEVNNNGKHRLSKRTFRSDINKFVPSKRMAMNHQKTDDLVALMRFASHLPCCTAGITTDTTKEPDNIHHETAANKIGGANVNAMCNVMNKFPSLCDEECSSNLNGRCKNCEMPSGSDRFITPVKLFSDGESPTRSMDHNIRHSKSYDCYTDTLSSPISFIRFNRSESPKKARNQNFNPSYRNCYVDSSATAVRFGKREPLREIFPHHIGNERDKNTSKVYENFETVKTKNAKPPNQLLEKVHIGNDIFAMTYSNGSNSAQNAVGHQNMWCQSTTTIGNKKLVELSSNCAVVCKNMGIPIVMSPITSSSK